MKASNIHFEQIPVETVKRIAKTLPDNDAIESDDVTTETRDEGTSQPKRWREMAQKAQAEDNPQKMIKLVEELINAFDEEELHRPGKTCRSGPAT